jgi:16S rRNA C967 or C1407 C5-methylase (RsmB/RsmF family)/NOL1/NOP2/fmu family ribosome biogenesis protein
MIGLPKEFIERIENDPFIGVELLSALETNSPVSIRRNPLKKSANLPVLKEIPWCKDAFYLTERPFYTKDPLFHAGCYYPQEAGSMFLENVLHQLEIPANPMILDLCAAPGGKSTLIASFLSNAGLLVSNEVIQQRSKTLKENMTKWGFSNSIVTNNDPADFARLTAFFDVIVVDAPCSGEGMFRKDHTSRSEWSQANVDLCAARQKRIVMDVWESLQPGGYLIYSTCTFNSQENEENITWFKQELDALIVPIETTHLQTGRNEIGHYAFPSQVDTEGFYICVLQKQGEKKHVKLKLNKKSEVSMLKDFSQIADFAELTNQLVVQWSHYTFAIPAAFRDEIIFLQNQMRVIKMGTELGEIAKKGLIPHEALALNPTILKSTFSKIELEKQDALKYLHGDTFAVPGNHGFNLMCYQEEPLGWIKHLGNRFNNLYPKDWRIRMHVD